MVSRGTLTDTDNSHLEVPVLSSSCMCGVFLRTVRYTGKSTQKMEKHSEDVKSASGLVQATFPRGPSVF